MLQLLDVCASEPAFQCFHGNRQKMDNPVILEKIVEQYYLEMYRCCVQNLGLSGPNLASKSAISNFQVTMATISHFDEFW